MASDDDEYEREYVDMSIDWPTTAEAEKAPAPEPEPETAGVGVEISDEDV